MDRSKGHGLLYVSTAWTGHVVSMALLPLAHRRNLQKTTTFAAAKMVLTADWIRPLSSLANMCLKVFVTCHSESWNRCMCLPLFAAVMPANVESIAVNTVHVHILKKHIKQRPLRVTLRLGTHQSW